MDKLEQYQIAIKQVLTEYHNWVSVVFFGLGW
jgi:hypothetical protein